MVKIQKRMQALSYPFSVYEPFLLSLIFADKNLRKKIHNEVVCPLLDLNAGTCLVAALFVHQGISFLLL